MPEETKNDNASQATKTWQELFDKWAKQGDGSPLTEGYCLLDNGLNAYQLFNNRENYQVNCFLVPNFLVGSDRFNIDNAFYMQWGKDVTELTLEDQLFSFGTSGSMKVADTLGNWTYLLEQFVSYDLVINVIQKLSEDTIIRYEPYIMSIVNVQEIDRPEPNTKILYVEFEDMITAESKKRSIGSLLKFDNSLKQSNSFPEVFKKIFDYLSDNIAKNSGGKLTYGKKIRFNNYKNANQNSLLEPIFDELDPEASIYDALQALSKNACVDVDIDKDLTNDFEMIGNVLIPVFFKEEYPDLQNYYYILSNEEGEDFDNVSTNKEGIFIPRPFTLRNFYMPFNNGFNPDGKIVFESFTTAQNQNDESADISTINGVNPLPINNVQALTSNSNLNRKRWKNLALISSNPNGGSNKLVFFNWIYQFFNRVFLKGKLDNKNVRLSNVTPGFYMAIQGDEEMMNDHEIAERNSNIILLKNEKADPLNEILMQIGKSIASLVFLNNMYSFEVEGTLFRRPNEIINLYTPHNEEVLPSQTIRTDFMRSDNVLLYVTSVIHTFSGNEFTDKVICNRIYEQINQS